MKSIQISLIAAMLLSPIIGHAQIRNAKTETVQVEGNCGMCETNIEKAGNVKKVAAVDWNQETKKATLTYDSTKTSADEILKRISLAGYDNEKYLAPDDVYAKLHGCCQYERVNKTSMKAGGSADHSAHKQVAAETTKAADHSAHMNPAATGSSKLQAVFSQYFSLKDALVKSDGAAASAAAKALHQSALAVKMETLSAEEHTAWMSVMKNLALDAEHIAETTEVGHQRDHFSSLSANMYTLLKASGQGETLYYQHCPMYNKGKGANWLSKESEIKNPYYGAQMLGCGKTLETIK